MTLYVNVTDIRTVGEEADSDGDDAGSEPKFYFKDL